MKQECPVVKNEIYSMDITGIGANGEGIGHIDGYTLFVDGAITGDYIEVKVIKTKKNYGFGRLVTILEPSKDRVEPRCPIAKQCGGCSIMHMSYPAQLHYKENHILDALERIGEQDRQELEQKKEPILGMNDPWFYRNKVQFPVQMMSGKLLIGFYAKRSHRIIETPICYIQDRYNEEIVDIIRDFVMDNSISVYDEAKHKGLLRHIVIRKSYHDQQFHVTLVINGQKLPHEDVLIKTLHKLDHLVGVSLNINQEKTNAIFGPRMIHLDGQEKLQDQIGDIKYQISPLSFYQVNPVQTEKLYAKALEYAQLSGQEIVYDLYCGIGTISLFLAKQAKHVYGVEIVETAIDDARTNAKINKIDNATFYAGKAEEIMPKLYKDNGIKADVVVVDPPRKGCDATLLDTIISIEPKRIVYVSCDPGTLARDVKILSQHGYQIDRWCGVDMFSHSTHVETVLSMKRTKL
jgi:23S rRNA (uracil1939-C5)-methyltransferase